MLSEDVSNNVITVDFKRQVRSSESAVEKPILDAALNLCAQKLKLFSEWIDLGMVMVIFDPRMSGVQVPKELAQECELRLNFSHRFDLKDFVYDQDGISATLMFPGGLFFCVVPWSSIFAMHSYADNSGAMWPDSLPKEFSIDVKEGNVEWQEAQAEPKARGLRLVTDADCR